MKPNIPPALFLMQPYFLPWISYFSRIVRADLVVFVDNQPFKKDYYINRARFLRKCGTPYWVTVPVSHHSGMTTGEIVLEAGATRRAFDALRGNIKLRDL